MDKRKFIYCAVILLICLGPSVGMLAASERDSSENRTLAELPSIIDENGYNWDWMSQMGDYFQDHFAFRSELVTTNAWIQGKILQTSVEDSVIQGSNGWLYYTDSLSDYLGTELLSDRSIYNIAHSLKMIQDNLKEKGVQFLFVAAPNKNSLYDENMPYYDKMKVSEERNLINLQQALTQMGVCYADLDGAFKEQDEVLYHKTDSHWNNKGAAFASGLILDTLQKSHKSYEEQEYEIREDFEGDLDQMLYPDAMTPDAEIYYINAPEFTYVEEVTSNFAPRISTVHEGGTGSLVMYRDSFGNALLPFLAEAYGEAYFSRGVPYQFSDVDTKAADCVIIERAERFLPEMAQNPPAMQAVAVEWTGEISELTADGVLDVTFGRQGNLIQMSGRILSGYLAEDTEIYIRVNGGEIYEAFPMDIKVGETTDSNGFCLYVSEETLLPEHNSFEIMVRNGEELNIVDTVESDINQES